MDCECLSGYPYRWDQIDLMAGLLHVNRLKNGVASTHPIRRPALRALRQLPRDYEGPYVFSTPPAIPSLRQIDSTTSGKIKLNVEHGLRMLLIRTQGAQAVNIIDSEA